jgi:hypothetical protein
MLATGRFLLSVGLREQPKRRRFGSYDSPEPMSDKGAAGIAKNPTSGDDPVIFATRDAAPNRDRLKGRK